MRVQHLNSIHENIRFTMQIEKDSLLPFQDVLVSKKPNGTVSHTAYRKPTHSDLYLHAKSHHHPFQKHVLLAALVNGPRLYVTQQVLTQRSDIQGGFQSYNRVAFNRVMCHENKITAEKQIQTGVAILSFQHTTSYRVSRLLGQFTFCLRRLPAWYDQQRIIYA